MKIILHMIDACTIEKFADEHGLVMEVREREPKTIAWASAHFRRAPESIRYYAAFKCSDTKNGCCLVGTYGNGATPEEAIDAYAVAISERLLVIDAMSDRRREIRVPVLVPMQRRIQGVKP